MSKQDMNSDESMYQGESHTALLSITGPEDSGPQEWHAIAFRAETDDSAEALRQYIDGLFGDEVDVKQDGDMLVVDEPGFPPGEFRRYYKIP